MRRVAVVDAQWGGHIEAYHQLVVQGLLEQGHAVLSLSPHPNRVAEWISSSCPEATRRAAFRTFERQQLAPRSASEPRSRPGRQIATRAIGAVPGVRSTWHLRRAVAQWRRVASAVRQVATKPPDLVFLPYLDGGFLHPMLTVGIVDRLCPMQWTG